LEKNYPNPKEMRGRKNLTNDKLLLY